MPNRIRPDTLIRFHSVERRSPIFSQKLGKLQALDAFRFKANPENKNPERLADRLKPRKTLFGKPNGNPTVSSRFKIKHILQERGTEIKATETSTEKALSVRRRHRQKSPSKHLNPDKHGLDGRIDHESDHSGPATTRLSIRKLLARSVVGDKSADTSNGQDGGTTLRSEQRPVFKQAARPPSGIPVSMQKRITVQAPIESRGKRNDGLNDSHLVRRLQSEKKKEKLVRLAREHVETAANSYGVAKRDVQDRAGEVQGRVQNTEGKEEGQTLGKEISIASALDSHHSENSVSIDLGQKISTDLLQSKLSTARTFRSVAKKPISTSRITVFTKCSLGLSSKDNSPTLSRRGKRRLAYLRRTKKRFESQGEAIDLKVEVPNAALAAFSKDSLQPRLSIGSEKNTSIDEPRSPPGNFSHVNRENIPFEEAWFDDIQQEQPPPVEEPSPSFFESKTVSYFKGKEYVTFRELKPTTTPLDSPVNDKGSLGGLTLHQTSSEAFKAGKTKDSSPSPEQIIHNTLTAPPVLGETSNEAVLKAIQKLSLRDELFPVELYPLPSKPSVPEQRNKSSDELPHMPFSFNSLEQPGRSDGRSQVLSSEVLSRLDTVAVLLLETASTALCEDDFQRLTLKGKHIEEWRSAGGSVHVIPVRHPETLFHRRCYFLLFPSIELARIYRDRVQEIHRIARTYTPTSIQSPMVPPPGMLVDGQNVHRLMQDFTLCPPGQELHIKLLKNPRGGYTKDVIANRGYHSIDPPGYPRRSGRSIVFWLKWYQPTTTAIIEFLTQDGRARGLPWGPMDGKGSVEKLQDPAPQDWETGGRLSGEEEQDEELQDEESQDGSLESQAGEHQHARWLISFEDENEARRFVRTWHQRPWPGIIGSDVSWEYADSTPLIQAEFLI